MNKPQKILVTGAKGQVGQEIVSLCEGLGFLVVGCGRDQLDISNPQDVDEFFEQHTPNIVVNAAAYTAVDKAESESELATQINAEAVQTIAQACQQHNAILIHLSTDYVFDGEKKSAYVETDPTNPLGVYGQSKLLGEQAIQSHCSQFYILRTSWVFGQFGHNFVKTMLRLAQQGNDLRVVADQIGTPTPARFIAETIIELILQQDRVPFGIYHLAGLSQVTWHEFACEIIERAHRRGICPKVDIAAITTDEFPTPAKRPKNSCLESKKLFQALKITPKTWHNYLDDILSGILTDH